MTGRDEQDGEQAAPEGGTLAKCRRMREIEGGGYIIKARRRQRYYRPRWRRRYLIG